MTPTSPPTPPPRRRWLRLLGWIGAALAALVLLLALGIFVLLRTGRLHQFLLRVARTQATAALGVPVQIGDFSFHWAGLAPSFDLENVAVAGAAPYANPPLLRIDRLHLALRITSLWHRAWYLEEVRADHPVVWFYTDPQGRTNLPHGGGGSGASIFDLGIRHLEIAGGAVDANSRPAQLEATLDNVRFQAAFRMATRTYTGQLDYTNGRIHYQNYAPFPHSLDLAFAASPSGIAVSRLALAAGPSRLEAAGRLDNYADPRVTATYRLALDTAQAGALLRQPALPAGVVTVAGSLAYADTSANSLINSLNAEGDFSSAALALHELGASLPVRSLAGHYQLAHGNLDVSSIRARVLGGKIEASLALDDLAGRAAAHLQAKLGGAALDQVAGVAGHASAVARTGIAGAANASADVTWDHAFDHLALTADATLAATIQATAAAAAPIPLNGVLHARYDAFTGQLALLHSGVTTTESSLTADGMIAADSRLQFRLQSQSLGELEAIADRVALAWSGHPLPGLGLAGAGSVAGSVTGALSDPHITGRLAASNLALRGTHWSTAAVAFAADPGQLRLSSGELQQAPTRIAFGLTAGLTQWAYREANPVAATLTATGVPLDELARLLARPLPASGLLAVRLSLHGSALHPEGQGSLTLAQAKLAPEGKDGVDEPLQSATLTFQGTGDAVTGKLALALSAGPLAATGTFYPQTRSYDVQLHADGIQLDRLRTLAAREPTLHGVVNVNGSGRGTVANPQFQATLTAPSLSLEKQPITALALQLGLANHSLHAVLDSKVVQTSLHGQATIAIGGDYAATAQLDTQTIPLAPLLALYAPALAVNVSGQTEIHARLQGPLKNISQLQAHLQLPVLKLNYGTNDTTAVQLAATAPVRLDLAHGFLTLQKTGIRGTGTDIQLAGSIPLARSASSAVSVTAVGTVDLALLHAFDPDVASAGQLALNLHSSGEWFGAGGPTATGEIRIVNASLATDALPAGLQNANGVLRLEGNRLAIANFSGTVGGGTVTATGAVVLRPALQFNFALAAREIRLLYPATVREGLDADLTFTGTPEQAYLNGRIRMESVSVTPQFDLTDFVSQVAGAGVSVAAPGSFSQNLALNLAVSTPNQINTATRDFSLQAGANLTIRGTAAEPVVLGRVSLTSGDLIFRGNRYVLQGGSLDFVNPNMTEPVVNLAADTTIQQYDLHLHFEGPTSNLQASYTSDPALPPADIINLLAFGQTNEASAANPTPGNLGAENLIAAAVSGQITDRVQKIAGISQISVDPVLGGNQQNADARITIQQRVTGNLFVTVSTDVAGTQRNVVEIQYQITPRVSVSAIRDQNGGLGVNARLKKTW